MSGSHDPEATGQTHSTLPQQGQRSLSRFGRFIRKPWVITLVVLNVAGVLVLAGSSIANTRSCGGGGYGYSGGSGCTADLQMQLTASATAVHLRDRVFFLAEVTNNGPDQTGFTAMTIALPKGVQVDWVMQSINQIYCSYSALRVSCRFYDLQAHERVAATVVVRMLVTGTRLAVAQVHPSFPDPNQANNTSKVHIHVTP